MLEATSLAAATLETCIPGDHVWGVCAAAFPTKVALQTHAYKVHGVKHPCRAYAAADVCVFWLTKFHTRARAIHHLRRQQACIANLKNALEPLTKGEQDTLGFEEKTGQPRRRTWGSTICLRSCRRARSLARSFPASRSPPSARPEAALSKLPWKKKERKHSHRRGGRARDV